MAQRMSFYDTAELLGSKSPRGKMKGSSASRNMAALIASLDFGEMAATRGTEEVGRLLHKAGTTALTRVTENRATDVVFGFAIEIEDASGGWPNATDDCFDEDSANVVRVWGLKRDGQSPYNPITIKEIRAVLSLDVTSDGTTPTAGHTVAQFLHTMHHARLQVRITNADAVEIPIGDLLVREHATAYDTTAVEIICDAEKIRGYENPGLQLVGQDDDISAFLVTADGDSITEAFTNFDGSKELLTVTFVAEAV